VYNKQNTVYNKPKHWDQSNKTLWLIKQNTVFNQKNSAYNKKTLRLIKQNTAINQTKHCV